MVRLKKTEHHGGDHAVRVVPICPELRAPMADAFEKAEPGAALIVPMANRKGVNLRTQRERIIAKAGHQVWPRLATPGRGRRATRIATPHASAQGSTEPHETTEPAATTGVTAGSSKVAPLIKNGHAAGCREPREKAGLAMDGSAAVGRQRPDAANHAKRPHWPWMAVRP